MSDAAGDLAQPELIRLFRERLGADYPAPILHRTTASTNDDAKQLAKAGAPHGTLVLADSQSQGRGRSGAVWHSPPAQNLYYSLLLRTPLSVASLPPLSLVVGLVVRAVAARYVGESSLKWPNDVLVRGHKLAGVLVESLLRGDQLSALVIGIGLNVHSRDFPEGLRTPATSLTLCGAGGVSRGELALAITEELLQAVDRYQRNGFVSFLDELRHHDALLGRPVAIGDVRGVAAGIDQLGQLLVQTDGGVVPVHAGQVDLL